MKTQYLIKASTIEDSMENWFWTNMDSISGTVKIINPLNKKSVIVFKRSIDENFINFYDSKKTIKIKDSKRPLIIINEYYRFKLGIEKNKEYELEIKNASCFNKIFNSNWEHPNPTISLSYKIGLISFLLSITSIILGLVSFLKY